MTWVWLEAALPMGIIAGMLCIMGNAQYYIHKAAHGRVLLLIIIDPYQFIYTNRYRLIIDEFWQPKHIGNDMWDVAMERRDKKLVDNLYASHN